MTEFEWMNNLHKSCKVVLPLESCRSAFNDKKKEIDEDFKWLREIADEAFKLFSSKRTKLEPMPKTPSMKARQTRRTKIIQAKIEEESQSSSKWAPTKLTFESPIEDENYGNNSERPTRQCRITSKPVYFDENELPQRSTRQSRTAVNSKAKKAVISGDIEKSEDKVMKSLTGNKGKKNSLTADISLIEDKDSNTHNELTNVIKKDNILTESNSSAEQNDGVVSYNLCNPKKEIGMEFSEDRNVKNLLNIDSKLKPVSKIDSLAHLEQTKKTITVPAMEQTLEKSHTVKDRTKAYECMLKDRASSSPILKTQHNGAPGSSKKLVQAAKVNTPIRADATTKNSHKPSSSSKTVYETLHQDSPKSSRRKSGKRKSSNVKKTPDVPRQTRTRLRLKKQEHPVFSETEQPSSTDSDSTVHISQGLDTNLQKDDSRDSLNEKNNRKCAQEKHQKEVLDETHTVITEVFEIAGSDQPARLKDYEIVQTKTTPVVVLTPLVQAKYQRSSAPNNNKKSDQGFDDGDEASADSTSDDCEPQKKQNENNYNNLIAVQAKPTRTRTRAQQKIEESNQTNNVAKSNKDSGIVSGIISKADVTFTRETSPISDVKSTRTRTRAQKESVDVSIKETERSTRTRQRKLESTNSSQDSNLTRIVPIETNPTDEAYKATRSKMRKIQDKLNICQSDDEIIAGSPVVCPSRPSLRGASKRIAEERGLSPRPKRSCIADQTTMSMKSPQLASSPIKKAGTSLYQEENDTLLSPLKSPRPYKFNTAQKKMSGFLNRTPGFGQNTSKLYSFLSNTPSCRTNSFLTSFVKRNTPPPKQNSQVLAEQKRQKLLEKEMHEKERLKKAAELRKRKIEDQKRLREEKEQKVAEAREMRLRNELEQKSRINKKFEDKALVKEKMLEERCKEEREKQKQRLKKQIKADARRKMEEEERLKKLIELEEEAKMHAEAMQRKKELEEAERRRQIAEEKRRQEERLAELEQKRQEELARIRQLEEERDKDAKRMKLEKEKQIAYERAEKERIEREKREEKERKIQEEMEKLKALEKERLRCQQEKLQQQKQVSIQQNEIKQMISKHNTTLSKQLSSTNVSNNAGNTSNAKISSYDLTPKKIINCKNKNPDNYDIEDRNSDDSTDDEEAPVKQIPQWANGVPLNSALIRQHTNPPDLEAIFRTKYIEPPNLVLVFAGNKRPRYHQRTSSAVWNSPPLAR